MKNMFVSCRSAEGHHTAQNIASQIDKVIFITFVNFVIFGVFLSVLILLKYDIIILLLLFRSSVSSLVSVKAPSGCVTDNAANMLPEVSKHTKKIDIGLLCFDHLLNLVVKATNLANEKTRSNQGD